MVLRGRVSSGGTRWVRTRDFDEGPVSQPGLSLCVPVRGVGLGVRRKVSPEAHVVLESLGRLAAKIGQRKGLLSVSPELRPYQIIEGCVHIGGKSDPTGTANPPIGLEIVWKQTNFAKERIHVLASHLLVLRILPLLNDLHNVTHSLVSSAATWEEAAVKARYLLNLYAETLAAGDTRTRTLIGAVLRDLEHLANEKA